jgi:hypothetical protein
VLLIIVGDKGVTGTFLIKLINMVNEQKVGVFRIALLDILCYSEKELFLLVNRIIKCKTFCLEET